jgi:four helix bundle protein
MENQVKKPIRGFSDLDVYKKSYDLAIQVAHKILSKLPESEKYDLRDQLSRSTKAVPRLIAEGFGKKHQRAGFQKYLDDAMTEVNETLVGLGQTKDIYGIEPELCTLMINDYDIIARQIFRLAETWDNFTNRRRKP